jgi:hypothetical protein
MTSKEHTMQFDLKPLPQGSVRAALDKAKHYRLLNEPWESESICLDVLRTEPNNQEALVTLVLSLTDQIARHGLEGRARKIVKRLEAEYDRYYYGGIVWERKGKVQIGLGLRPSIPYDSLRRAMEKYEKAMAARPQGNDDAVLRWNTCARLIMDRRLEPDDDYNYEPYGD